MIGRFLGRVVIAGLAVVTAFVLLDLFTPMNAPVGKRGDPLPGTKNLAIRAKGYGAKSIDQLRADVDKLQKRLFVFSPWPSRAEVSLKELHPIDLSALPVIEDCAALGEPRFDSYFTAPLESEAGADAHTAWLASVLETFELRPGYTIGLRRKRELASFVGLLCRSDWTVGVRDEAAGKILEREQIAQAFVLRPEDLPLLGQVLYGPPRFVSALQKEYQRVVRAPVCARSSGHPCNEFTPRSLPRIADGALTRSLLGTIVLHRFTSGGRNPNLTYRRCYIRNGSLQMIEDAIYELNTGIAYD